MRDDPIENDIRWVVPISGHHPNVVIIHGVKKSRECTIRESILLSSTSFLFFVPGIYGIAIQLYVNGAFSMVAGGVSILYWINPRNNWRLKLDRIVSRTLFVFYTMTGIYCARSISQPGIIASFPLTFLMMACYYMSNNAWTKNQDRWVYYHAFFHLCGSLNQLNTLFVIASCNPICE